MCLFDPLCCSFPRRNLRNTFRDDDFSVLRPVLLSLFLSDFVRAEYFSVNDYPYDCDHGGCSRTLCVLTILALFAMVLLVSTQHFLLR